MNEKIWNQSNKGYFPYNCDVWYACLMPMLGALVILVLFMQFTEGFETHLQTIMLTFLKSIVAYWVSDKLILAFKDKLRDKGLFGRDLNKSGI